MKVLMQCRKNFYELRGGDTVQLLKTKEELEKLGVEVDINLELKPNLTKYDLVHLANITRIQETYVQIKNAKEYNKPVALSTIYWPMEEFEQMGQLGVRKIINKHFSMDNIEKIKIFLKALHNKTKINEEEKNIFKLGYLNMQNYVLQNSDILLPNSEMEMNKIKENFDINEDKAYIVVPNGIDLNLATKQLESNVDDKFKEYKDAIICVGRIETRKNQLSLVKALDKKNYKLILVGDVSNNQKQYYNKIKKIIDRNQNFKYIPRIDNDELYKLYKVCKISVLPSWYDTPGLVSLEAGSMGCNLVVSSKGTTKEYFGNNVEYCEPDDIDSIYRAINKAYLKEKNNILKNIILKNYTWEQAAIKTKEAYEMIIGK